MKKKCGAWLLGVVITQGVEGTPSRMFFLYERPLKILSLGRKRGKRVVATKRTK
jgi:hypothetical protein